MLNIFKAAAKLLDASQSKRLKISEKLDLFFLDYNIMPLMVHESYTKCYHGPDQMSKIASASDFLSFGDTISLQVWQDQDYALLTDYGLMACVAPSMLNPNGFINYCPFPEMMGKTNTIFKVRRQLNEV